MVTSRKHNSRFLHSRKALAVPVTYLILFVSTMLLISVTYVFAVQQVNNRQQSFQILTARQDMISLDNDILSVTSQPGSATVLDFRDSGGQLNIEPSSNNLTLSVTDDAEINATIFNETTGQMVYNLPPSESEDIGFYIEGDSCTITNQSGASMSQLCIVSSLQGPQIQLGYRPQVTYVSAGIQNGQPVTDIRIYIVNLNSSTAFSLGGELPLKISCLSAQLATSTYKVSYPIENLVVTSQLNGLTGKISVPVSSASAGAIINVQIVSSNLTVEEGTP
jgi:hypothetical protein